MSSWIHRILDVRCRPLVDDLAALTTLDLPCYPSSSGFRFVYDPSVPPDVADASAPVQALGLGVQALADPDVLAAGAANGPDGDAEPQRPDGDEGGGRPDPAVTPAATQARELADQAARALVNGWSQEASELFLAAAHRTPTEPHLWFGAGVAAARHDPAAAAHHLLRASRYYRLNDLGASVYCLILAACIHEDLGDAGRARQILSDGLVALDRPCPALSLHLARLRPDRQDLLDQALSVDPMVEIDISALGFDPDPGLVRRRCLQLRREIARIEAAIAELRRVDGGATWPDPPRPPVPGTGRDRFPIVALELALAAKLTICGQAIATAREEVDRRERLRRLREGEWVDNESLARYDLDNRRALPVLAACAASTVLIIVVALLGRMVMLGAPAAAPQIAAFAWIVLLLLAAGAWWLVIATLWTYRRYPLARRARDGLPQLRAEAAKLREDEFAVRQRFERARVEAGRQMALIRERRDAVIPRRPPATASWRLADRSRPAASSSE